MNSKTRKSLINGETKMFLWKTKNTKNKIGFSIFLFINHGKLDDIFIGILWVFFVVYFFFFYFSLTLTFHSFHNFSCFYRFNSFFFLILPHFIYFIFVFYLMVFIIFIQCGIGWWMISDWIIIIYSTIA